MSSHIENTAWKQAELDHARPGTKLDAARLAQKGEHGGRRLAPFYKVMPGMPIAVDAFRYGKIPGVKAYFLTHAHSDHYTALNEKWANGPIYCSETTGNLIRLMLGVNSKWIHPVPMDVPTLVPETEVTVTLVEANHCPGSVLFLFEGRRTVNAGDSTFKSPHVGSPRVFRYLHCGDFRASPQHALHAAIKGKKLDIIYLDTTYLNPKYCFPPQRQVIDACATLATRLVLGTEPTNSSESDLTGKISMKPKPSIDVWARPIVKGQHNDDASLREGRTLVMVGTYSIGKERIVKAIANALSSKVYCDKRKAAILRCQDDPELHALLTNDPYEAQIHLVPLGALNRDKIGDYLSQFKGAYTRVVGFRPTGWTYSPPAGTDTLPALAPLITRMQSRTFLPSSLVPTRNSTPRLMLYGVPYSEHSSFLELSCFALSTHWDKIIATVNVGTESGRGKMNRWFEKWESEIKRRREKGENGMVGFRSIEYW
ncbi:DRMBL-domain-containing protein [Cantharellus anzutake]|uniref:DRMBL-domain-containing protein n=1 Tax=Cantharellus anzutake TaxID=1750568 RepID=UPI0019061E77|nr:DRMBL-domain-containing protein [Cantharellus anzutake]KAF8323475.1 DRMBL-domain-containing protein [Cantharellus anzutake]